MLAPYHETLLAFDVLEEMERIDGLVEQYDAALAAVRPRMEADELNRDFQSVVARLRYDPDAVPVSQWRREDVMHAAGEIMKRFRSHKPAPPVS